MELLGIPGKLEGFTEEKAKCVRIRTLKQLLKLAVRAIRNWCGSADRSRWLNQAVPKALNLKYVYFQSNPTFNKFYGFIFKKY